MRKQLYWLSDAEWKRLEPLLPRGRRGAHRVDDRRIISGIMHMLRSGARWRDCPPEYGPYTTIYNRFNRWSRQGIWFEMFEALTGSTGIIGTVAIDSSHIKAHRSAAGGKGTFREAIGRSRGGRTTKIHALTDAEGRPRVLLLSPGNVNDIALAPALLAAAGPIKHLIADKAYDANSLRRLLAGQGAKAVIPSTTSRNRPIPYNKALYRQRNLIERMFARLKDFRRVATRYDKLARNFLAGAIIAATVVWWLN
ncbi:MAG TPA: IS5 family transposase [Methyloceanibacter sp.]|nr:IS5 family transposase [Methyloceanibacter sp.]